MEEQFVSKFATMEEEKLNLTETSIKHIAEVAKWTKFFAILGYITIGFLIVIALFMGFVLPSLNQDMQSSNPAIQYPIVFSIVYLLIAALYLYPSINMNRFANKVKEAINKKDSIQLEEGFGDLKGALKFMGILTIIFISLYFVLMVVGFAFGALSNVVR